MTKGRIARIVQETRRHQCIAHHLNLIVGEEVFVLVLFRAFVKFAVAFGDDLVENFRSVHGYFKSVCESGSDEELAVGGKNLGFTLQSP